MLEVSFALGGEPRTANLLLVEKCFQAIVNVLLLRLLSILPIQRRNVSEDST